MEVSNRDITCWMSGVSSATSTWGMKGGAEMQAQDSSEPAKWHVEAPNVGVVFGVWHKLRSHDKYALSMGMSAHCD